MIIFGFISFLEYYFKNYKIFSYYVYNLIGWFLFNNFKNIDK